MVAAAHGSVGFEVELKGGKAESPGSAREQEVLDSNRKTPRKSASRIYCLNGVFVDSQYLMKANMHP